MCVDVSQWGVDGGGCLGFDKASCHTIKFGLADGVRSTISVHDLFEFRFNFIDVALTFGFDQNFDASFVQVVTATPTVVNADNSFQVIHDVLPWQEITNQCANDGCAAHATAHPDFEAYFALCIFDKLQANVVPTNGSAVFVRACDGDLELAWQKCKLRVQRAPLSQNFCIGPRVDHFINGYAR